MSEHRLSIKVLKSVDFLILSILQVCGVDRYLSDGSTQCADFLRKSSTGQNLYCPSHLLHLQDRGKKQDQTDRMFVLSDREAIEASQQGSMRIQPEQLPCQFSGLHSLVHAVSSVPHCILPQNRPTQDEPLRSTQFT